MSKREFLIQYVLNRALANSGGLEGLAVSQEALKAWEFINENISLAEEKGKLADSEMPKLDKSPSWYVERNLDSD